MHVQTSVIGVGKGLSESVWSRKERGIKMVSSRLLQVVAVVVMLLAVAATGAGANVAYAAEPSVPFKASVSGTVSLIDARRPSSSTAPVRRVTWGT